MKNNPFNMADPFTLVRFSFQIMSYLQSLPKGPTSSEEQRLGRAALFHLNEIDNRAQEIVGVIRETLDSWPSVGSLPVLDVQRLFNVVAIKGKALRSEAYALLSEVQVKLPGGQEMSGADFVSRQLESGPQSLEKTLSQTRGHGRDIFSQATQICLQVSEFERVYQDISSKSHKKKVAAQATQEDFIRYISALMQFEDFLDIAGTEARKLVQGFVAAGDPARWVE